jgi:hypothetical protein
MRLPNGTCPVCYSKIIASDIDLHPSRPDLAIQNFWCPKCERVVKSVTYSLKPKKE